MYSISKQIVVFFFKKKKNRGIFYAIEFTASGAAENSLIVRT